MTIVDVSNPASPSQAGTVTVAGASHVALTGDYALVAAYDTDSLVAVDISNPASPSVVDTITSSTYLNGASGVSVAGDHAYVTSDISGRLAVIDLGCTLSAPSGCKFPEMAKGGIYYDDVDSVPLYCDGSAWIALGLPDVTASGTCSSPAADEGAMFYNASSQRYQYCNGNEWRGFIMAQ